LSQLLIQNYLNDLHTLRRVSGTSRESVVREELVAEDFNEIWIIDLKGNARTSGERRRREGGNIFEDQIRVGIAIYFCVKDARRKGCSIRYQAVRDYPSSEEKNDSCEPPWPSANLILLGRTQMEIGLISQIPILIHFCP
jgi:hypothetical protein